MPLPPLPGTVYSVLGPIPVGTKRDLKDDDGERALGLWLPEERRIWIIEGLDPVAAWATLLHERLHQILWDSGARPSSREEEERICDAVATAFLAERIAGPSDDP